MSSGDPELAVGPGGAGSHLGVARPSKAHGFPRGNEKPGEAAAWAPGGAGRGRGGLTGAWPPGSVGAASPTRSFKDALLH